MRKARSQPALSAQETLRDVLAKNMRMLRRARGLSQQALADEIGIDRTYCGSVERAERNVSIDNVACIAKALAVEPWKLLKEGRRRQRVARSPLYRG
jgi:transcriptional regulator with XRE-family HTH domain